MPARLSPLVSQYWSVLVCFPEFIVGVPEHVQEIAVLAFRALATSKHAANGSFPLDNVSEFTVQSTATVPAAIKFDKSLTGFLLTLVLNVNIASKMWLMVAAHFKLHDATNSLQFRQHIAVEIDEVLIHFVVLKLERHICVIIITPGLLQSKVHIHARYHYGAT